MEEVAGAGWRKAAHATGVASPARPPAQEGGEAVLCGERAIEVEGHDARVVSRIVHDSPKKRGLRRNSAVWPLDCNRPEPPCQNRADATGGANSAFPFSRKGVVGRLASIRYNPI